jgi:hypothetical protein
MTWTELARIEVESLMQGSDDPDHPVNRALARDIVGRAALDSLDRCYAPTRVPGTRKK